MTTSEAVKKLSSSLKKDKYFREAWTSSIAMAYLDAHESYKKTTGKKVITSADRMWIGSIAAELFIEWLSD